VLDAALTVLTHLNRHASGDWEFHPLDQEGAVLDLSWDERLTVPIVLEDGSLAAALRRPAAGDVPGDEELADVRSFARLLGALISTERSAQDARRIAAEASAAALSDQLTGLANRRAWREALRREEGRCARSNLVAAVAVVDLDDLKVVNDQHGHLAGDLLIKMAADTVGSIVRGSDLVARLGGDEFGVLAVDYEEPTTEPLIARLEAALDERGVVASIGAALHRPGDDMMRTFHHADMAMYEAKRLRKSEPPHA
jgi:diguanylate cyclase (GGDEF)-like protein